MGNCQAIRPKGLIVLPNGDLHKCWDTVSETKLKLGSVFNLEEFFNADLYKRWMNWTPFENNICSDCILLPCCTGFCAYKHLFGELTSGEAGSIPCPSWKYNVNERLFLRAQKRGFVTTDDWDEKKSPTSEVYKDDLLLANKLSQN